MAVVVVRATTTVSDGQGGLITLQRGDAWDDSHHVVKLHPDCFDRFAPVERGGIEQATAAPGEKRGNR